MSTKPKVLLLEDTRTEREELSELFKAMGLEVWPTSSPKKARTWMKQHGDYDIAVVDWDMARSEDSRSEPTSRMVLEKLARSSRDTLTLVHAGNLLSLRTQKEIQLAHPQALLHDKAHGELSLQDRITTLLSTPVGDIALDDVDRGHVIHLPSQHVFRHRLGFRLLTRYPNPIVVVKENNVMWCAMFRFKRWLKSCGSVVSIEAVGERSQRYRLVVREE